jgi:hypothetical protein
LVSEAPAKSRARKGLFVAAIVIPAVVWVSEPALVVLHRMRSKVNLGGFSFPGQKTGQTSQQFGNTEPA